MSLQGALIFWITFWLSYRYFRGTARSLMKSWVVSSGSKEVAETWRSLGRFSRNRGRVSNLEWWKPNQKQIALVRARNKCSVSSFPLYCCRVWAYKWYYYRVRFSVYSKPWCFSVGKLYIFPVWEISLRLVVSISPSGSSTCMDMDIFLVSQA